MRVSTLLLLVPVAAVAAALAVANRQPVAFRFDPFAPGDSPFRYRHSHGDGSRQTSCKPVRTSNMKTNPIFVALDTPLLDVASAMAARVAPHVGGWNIGL